MPEPRERFYLLPGMGGSALRRKRKIMLQWSSYAGLLLPESCRPALLPLPENWPLDHTSRLVLVEDARAIRP